MSSDDVLVLASEIERYLAAHPDAADSLEGIHRWWLARQRFEESLIQVQNALDHLERRGIVAKTQLAGKVVYASASKNA